MVKEIVNKLRRNLERHLQYIRRVNIFKIQRALQQEKETFFLKGEKETYMQFTKKKKKIVTNHNLTNRQIPVKSTYEMPLLFCNTWAKIKHFFFLIKLVLVRLWEADTILYFMESIN